MMRKFLASPHDGAAPPVAVLPGTDVWLIRNAVLPERTHALQHELRKLPHWEYRKIVVGDNADAQQHRRSCGLAVLPWLAYGYSGTNGGDVRPFGPEVRRLANTEVAEAMRVCCCLDAADVFPSNYSLCNWYADGTETVDWHSDNTADLASPYIVSVSVGASRKFELRLIGGGPTVASVLLHDGDILIMGRGVQQKYKHRIAPNAKCVDERFNLTFRCVNDRPVRIGLASLSRMKHVAVDLALKGFMRQLHASVHTVTSVEAPSGVSEQPVGLPETLHGAITRLNGALHSFGEMDDASSIDVVLAIENGLVELPDGAGWIDMAVITASLPAFDMSVTATSAGVPVPSAAVEMARTTFKTIGDVVDPSHSKNPQATLTSGMVSREDQLAQAVRCALGALVHAAKQTS